MASTYENRRENLRKLVEQWGGPKPLAGKLGYRNASFLVQMAGPNPNREVTEKTARKIEEALDLRVGWLDQVPGEHSANSLVDMTLVASVIRVVAQTAEDLGIELSPAKLGDIVVLVYSDAEAHQNNVRPEFVNSVLQLLR